MKTGIAAGVGLAMATLMTLPAAAEPLRYARVWGERLLPPYEAVTIVRSTGLAPIGRPRRHGATYVVHAVDRVGREMRVLVDARYGEVLAVEPAFRPRRPVGGPRIVSVLPEPDDPSVLYGDADVFDDAVAPRPPRVIRADPSFAPEPPRQPPLPRARPPALAAATAPIVTGSVPTPVGKPQPPTAAATEPAAATASGPPKPLPPVPDVTPLDMTE